MVIVLVSVVVEGASGSCDRIARSNIAAKYLEFVSDRK
jgi:hypothetical protein